MATTERPEASGPAASAVAARCQDAGLVRLVGTPRGRDLAAVGLLARALADAGVPFQAAIERDPRDPATDVDATLALGHDHGGPTYALEADPVSRAYAVAAELAEPDPILGLAGVIAAAGDPAGPIYEDATGAGVHRRPGLALPTADLADGLAHSTLAHGPFSKDTAAARTLVAEADPGEQPAADDRRRLASAVVLAVAAESPPDSRAGQRIERLLRPFVGGPVDTVGGYADVLDALARRAPGRGLATALGSVDVEAALSVWRGHADEVHRGVESAAVRRHDGLEVAHVDGVAESALEPIARLRRDFRAREPAVLVLGDTRAALATADADHAARTLREADTEAGCVVGDACLASGPLRDVDLETAVEAAVGGES